MDDLPEMDRFAPLSAEEISAAPKMAKAEAAEIEVITPVPADAPAPSFRHSRHGEPASIWTYRDASGAVLFHVCRFDKPDGGKEFAPRAWGKLPTGKHEWLWKMPTNARPLYGLDRLAANPSAAAIIGEGERATDAAALIFPKSVAMCWTGGSNAVDKTDFTPLAGRKVMLWPDHDEPGLKCMAKVASILSDLGCDISMIDSAKAAALVPDNAAAHREPSPKWDAADAVTEWSDLGALRKAIFALAEHREPPSAFVSFGRYEMTADGLTIEVDKGKGENKTTETVWISAPFEILGACRDPRGNGWGKWLRWRDGDGRAHVQHVPDAASQGEPGTLCGGLVSGGLRINRSQQRHFASYLSGVTVKGRVTVVDRTGWHDIGGHSVFVLAEETIGPRGSETVILDSAAIGPYDKRGTLKDWQAGVGTLATGHALPMLTISTALAGPLLHLAGIEGGGINIFGGSSKGKTTVIQAAASVWGRGSSPGYVRAWRATANGLEGAAASASDTVLVLDELGMIDARDAAAALYGLSNGTGKARAGREGGLREPKTWRVLTLSTGEMPVETKLNEDRGRKARAGQLVRMLDVPADRGFGFGAFDHGGPENDPGKLAKAFKQAAITAFGTPGPDFVRRLIAEQVTGEHVRSFIADFVAANTRAGSDGQIDRAAQRFGLIAAAGEFATEFGITPWQPGEARAAAVWGLEQWIALRGGTEPAEDRQALEQVRLAIEQHGDSRFESLDDPDARMFGSRLGWRRGGGEDRVWMIPPEIWKAEICNGLDAQAVARVLSERGYLKRQNDKTFQSTVKIKGASHRAYVLTSAILEGYADAP